METTHVQHIVYDHHRVRVFVISVDDTSESLLASSVPELQLHEVAPAVSGSALEGIYLNRKSTPRVGCTLSSKVSSA
jgi:hypothetical protein